MLGKLAATCKKNEVGSYLHWIQKLTQNGLKVNMIIKTTALLKENMGKMFMTLDLMMIS
jgi:hypothetical protein